MKIFLDTSSLIKLYHEEPGTERLDRLFQDYSISTIYLSALAIVEFNSAVWKKVRVNELTEDEALALTDALDTDIGKYDLIHLDSDVLYNARLLISKYGSSGLRTLDSVQLASAIKCISEIEFFFQQMYY